MGLILQSCIDNARGILQDLDVDDTRYSDADLLEYGNGALRSLPTIRPELCYEEGELECEVGKALQSVSFDDAHSLVDVVRIKDGSAVLKCDKVALDAFNPTWMTTTAAAAQNWMPNGNDPRRFYLYPPAPAAQVLEVIYVAIPGPFAAGDDTGFPLTLTEAVTDYIVGMAESRDDEHVTSQRAAQFIAQFASRLKG
jgi:hypothetical protein